jgi:ubiquinone/menaquinone biosynthesis C-methylase UbiE
MENIKAVLEYYETHNEDKRLLERCNIEFIRTKDIILRHLPNKPVKIIDLCGASGHYAYWLAELGHEVHLMDLSPKHIKEAKQNAKLYSSKLKSIKIGDVRNLKYKNETFDIVLLMGALYHLQEKDDRVLCLRETNRILKKGGIAIFTYISRFGSFMDGFKKDSIGDPIFQELLEQELFNGKHNNPNKIPGNFTSAYFHSTAEIKEELLLTKYKDIILYAVEGFTRLIDAEKYLADEEKLKILLKYLKLFEQDMETIGISDHKIVVCKK